MIDVGLLPATHNAVDLVQHARVEHLADKTRLNEGRGEAEKSLLTLKRDVRVVVSITESVADLSRTLPRLRLTSVLCLVLSFLRALKAVLATIRPLTSPDSTYYPCHPAFASNSCASKGKERRKGRRRKPPSPFFLRWPGQRVWGRAWW